MILILVPRCTSQQPPRPGRVEKDLGVLQEGEKAHCMANHAKICSYWTVLKYKFGYEVPQDFTHAIQIDKKCGSTK